MRVLKYEAVYIAGPMSFRSDSDFNYPAFNEAEARLLADGYHSVFNPTKTDGGLTDKPREFYLREALRLLLQCKVIALLPGWQTSQGALLEISIGTQLGMNFICAETLAPLDITANCQAVDADGDIIDTYVYDDTIDTTTVEGADEGIASSCLDEAAKVVDGPRQEAYGHPFINHSTTASFWSTYKGVEFSPEDVCWMMVLQKISREMNCHKDDNEVDVCGYARNHQMVREYRANTEPQ